MSDESTQFRKPTNEERHLIATLAAKAGDLGLSADWIDMLEVYSLPDGGMGSLTLRIPEVSAAGRIFGKRAAELIFEDDDGVKVIASLNLDKWGMPLELDIWKSDFSPVNRLPINLNQKRSKP